MTWRMRNQYVLMAEWFRHCYNSRTNDSVKGAGLSHSVSCAYVLWFPSARMFPSLIHPLPPHHSTCSCPSSTPLFVFPPFLVLSPLLLLLLLLLLLRLLLLPILHFNSGLALWLGRFFQSLFSGV